MTTSQRLSPIPYAPPASLVQERVILVDASDREVGSEEKLRAHEKGVLHRAFSVFLFDRHGRTLVQRRADSKYHSAGLWSNTCCGHPRPGETTAAAASRRLREEMGIECALAESFVFTYRAELDCGLVEHEIDHVFTGVFRGTPSPDTREVEAWGWIFPVTLASDCAATPERYSAWLPIALREIARRR